MKCNNCGFEFNEGMFCPECGTKYTEAVSISSQTTQNVQVKKNENRATVVNNNQKSKEKKDRTPGVVLTLGIISILTGWMIIGIIPAIIAIIKGIKGLKKNKNDSRIIAGMVCGGITVAFLILVFVCDVIDNHKTKIIADYMNNQQYAEALEYMDEKSWGTRYNKFDCYVGLGQYDEAADIILNYVNGIEDEAKLVEKSTAEIEKLESIYDLVSDDKRIEIDSFTQKVSGTKAKLEKEQEEAEAKAKEEAEAETTKPETKEQDETVVESDEVFESSDLTKKEPLFSVYVDSTSGYVDLRKGSSESYEVLTQIPSDTVLVVYDYSSDTEEWYEVEYEGNVGWISSGQTMIIPELRDDITQYESDNFENPENTSTSDNSSKEVYSEQNIDDYVDDAKNETQNLKNNEKEYDDSETDTDYSDMTYIVIDIEYVKSKGLKYNDPAILCIDGEEICKLYPGDTFQTERIVDFGKHEIYLKKDALLRKGKSNKIKVKVESEGEYFKIKAKEGSIKGLSISLE